MQEEVNEAVDLAAAEPTESSQTHDERQPTDQGQSQKRNDVEYNWAEARRKMQELERITQQQQEMINRMTSSQQEEEDDELDRLSDDDLLTVAQARKIGSREAKRIADEAIRQRENATMEDRLYAKYPDYTQVVTNESIEYLKQMKPKLAMSLSALANNPFEQAEAAYEAIKMLNQNQGTQSMPVERKKAADNSKKPVSVNSISKGSSPIGNAHLFENGLTPELKKSLWKEMQDATKQG